MRPGSHPRRALGLAAAAALLALAPAPASAQLSVSGTPSVCIFQQHWETVGGGPPYINVDRGSCRVQLSWSFPPSTCPPGPMGQEGRGGTGLVYHKRYYRPDYDDPSLPMTWSQPPGGVWTAASSIGVSPTTTELFSEVDGEKTFGPDLWKIGDIVCHFGGGPIESPAQSVTIVVRGPNYSPPAGGDPPPPPPPPPPPCPEAESLNSSSRGWNTQAQQMTGRANEANAEVIRLAEEARDAFLEALGVGPTDIASDRVVEGTIEALDEAVEIAAKKRINTADMDRSEVLTLFRLKKYLQRLEVADKVLGRVALAKGLYLLGLAAQKGVERDSYRRLASEALARSELLRSQSAEAFTRCQAGARATAAARKRPKYARLAPARLPLALKPTKRSGLPRALATLMAGEQDANALQLAIKVALGRAELARKAGNGTWQTRQLGRARTLAGRLARRLDAQAALRERPLPAALRVDTRLAVKDGMSAALRRLRLPSPVRQLLKRLKLDAAPFERGWRAPPAGGEVVSRSLASVVGDPAAIARDRARAAEWRGFAAL
jgi:hypothetical protein